MNREMWRPSPARVAASALSRFVERAEAAAGRHLDDYSGLHRWSVEAPEVFWSLVLAFTEVVYDGPLAPGRVGTTMPGGHFFPEASLNFAENLLRHAQSAP